MTDKHIKIKHDIEKILKLIKNLNFDKDINDADIVTENNNDVKMFDTCQVNSFSPFMESSELMPNYQKEEVHQPIKQHNNDTKLPESGQFEYNEGQPRYKIRVLWIICNE